MTIGFDHPLYILSFDHRRSFQTMFGWNEPLRARQIVAICRRYRQSVEVFEDVRSETIEAR